MKHWMLAILQVLAADVCATTYYVGPGGDNSNSGLVVDKPFSTLQHAADIVQPGDSVVAKNGLYESDGNWTVVYIANGGTASAPITFEALNVHKAKIGDAFATSYGFAFAPGVGHVVIRGFDIQRVLRTGVIVGKSNTDITITGNRFHHIGRTCTDETNGHNGILISGHGHTISYNRFYRIGRLAPGERDCYPVTTNYQNHDHGIYVYNAVDLLITNNIFRGMLRGWPVQIYDKKGRMTRGVTIQYNRFTGANPYRAGQIELGEPGLMESTIRNNLFAFPRGAAVHFSGQTYENIAIENNIIQGTTIIAKPASVSGVTIVK